MATPLPRSSGNGWSASSPMPLTQRRFGTKNHGKYGMKAPKMVVEPWFNHEIFWFKQHISALPMGNWDLGMEIHGFSLETDPFVLIVVTPCERRLGRRLPGKRGGSERSLFYHQNPSKPIKNHQHVWNPRLLACGKLAGQKPPSRRLKSNSGNFSMVSNHSVAILITWSTRFIQAINDMKPLFFLVHQI